jgi:hypothetical protein
LPAVVRQRGRGWFLRSRIALVTGDVRLVLFDDAARAVADEGYAELFG